VGHWINYTDLGFPSFSQFCTFSQWPISMNVTKLVDSTEDSILAQFYHPMSCSFYKGGCKIHKKLHSLACGLH
jgi:hypothetical protein